jgi:molecular chaperone DnaJ
MTEDLYDALGVPKDADKAAIRKAYRRKAKAAHPKATPTKKRKSLSSKPWTRF